MGQKSSKKSLPTGGSVTVRNSSHFVNKLAEIAGFSKTLSDLIDSENLFQMRMI